MFAQLNHIQWLMAEFLQDMVRTIQETQIKTIEIFYRAAAQTSFHQTGWSKWVANKAVFDCLKQFESM